MRLHVITYNVRGLPWCRNHIQAIASWLGASTAPLLCLQEVFTASGRAQYTALLKKAGYRVLLPLDDIPTCVFPSGLLIAVRPERYQILSTSFQPYLHSINVDRFANKGFFTVRLYDRLFRRRCCIINTHTQSDWELSDLFGRTATERIRRKQAEQILAAMKDTQEPVFVVGDHNQEHSPHPYLRFLHPVSALPLKKTTFMESGEDLDHLAWLPLQWTRPGCTFCDVRDKAPRLIGCQIHQHPWSDHACVEMQVDIPLLPTEVAWISSS